MPGLNDNILATIGRTPVVRLNRLAPDGVKDRLALGVIEAAERAGALRPGQTVIEATSGNTGIGLAMVCAAKGYPLVVTMAENFSVERRRLMRFLGARVVLTPAAEKGTGMLAKAVELAEQHGWFLCPAVRERGQRRHAHAHDRAGDPRRLRGAAARLVSPAPAPAARSRAWRGAARRRPDTRIVVCEPDNAAGARQRHRPAAPADGAAAASHPRSGRT